MSFWKVNKKLSWAFILISIFLTAQLVWWIFFFSYQSELLLTEKRAWSENIEKFFRDIKKILPSKYRSILKNKCEEFFSRELLCKDNFSRRRELLYRLENKRRRYLRMLLFEGLFFFGMIAVGLFLLWQGLKLERQLKKEQQNFVSAVSHELRTPIGTLKLLIDTSLSRPLEPKKQLEYLRMMARQLHNLESICEQLLAAASIDRYRENRQRHSTEINSVISGVLEKRREQLSKVSLHWRPFSFPVYLSIPKFYIELIASNLIDNALKYNNSDNKRLHISLRIKESRFEMVIEDNGPGIPTEELKRLYQPFCRLERDRKSRGLGLGLYIIKTLCQDSGGDISYQGLNPGSRFILSWPLEKVKFESDSDVALET